MSTGETSPEVTPMGARGDEAVAGLELTLLLEALHARYGYDFRDYGRPMLLRRVRQFVAREGLESISQLQGRVLTCSDYAEQFLESLLVGTTSMFRDHGYHRKLRSEVVPFLNTFPFFRVWHAGCSTGEELYSLTILLEEAQLSERARLYGTDLSAAALERARRAIYPVDKLREFVGNYHASGGHQDFSTYYTASGSHAVLSERLRGRAVFARHNLCVDGPFNEFHAISCRNVLIYFNRDLQRRVLRLFHASLRRFGLLMLGSQELLIDDELGRDFELVHAEHRIYRRIR